MGFNRLQRNLISFRKLWKFLFFNPPASIIIWQLWLQMIGLARNYILN